MTNLELLQDNLEDAEFALMMAEYAQYRGQLLIEENERLKNDPSAAVPEAVTRKNLNFIRREMTKRSRSRTLRSIGGKALRFVLAAALAALLFTAAYALSPEFRAGTLNLLMQVDEKAATIQFKADDYSDGLPELGVPEAAPVVTVGWVPEGYVGQLPVSGRLKSSIDIVDDHGSLIQVMVLSESQSTYLIDTEDADYFEELSIQGQPALMVFKDDHIRVTWADASTGLLVHIESDAIDTDTLIRVAESVAVSQ